MYNNHAYRKFLQHKSRFLSIRNNGLVIFNNLCSVLHYLFFFYSCLIEGWCYPALKLLGGRGETRPPSRVSVPPLTFRVPHRDLASPHRDSHIALKTFFWSLLDFGAKNSSIFGKDFFLVFTQFWGRKNIISTKVLSHSECVWSRLQKRPTVQNFTV